MKTDRNDTSLQTTTTYAHVCRNVLRYGLVLAIGIFLSACKRDAGRVDASDRAAVYTLVSVNGDRVPAQVSHDGTALEVRSGTFTIKADGTCSSLVVFVPPTGSETSREVTATYTQAGSTLNMQWNGAGRTTGTIQGDTFTMNNEGMLFAYKK